MKFAATAPTAQTQTAPAAARKLSARMLVPAVLNAIVEWRAHAPKDRKNVEAVSLYLRRQADRLFEVLKPRPSPSRCYD